MRILMANSWFHTRGGDSTAAWGLARRLEGAGHTVIPLAIRHPENDPSPWAHRWPAWVDFRDPADATHRLESALSLAWSQDALRCARALIRDTRPDVFHAHHIHRHLTPSVLFAAREAGIPVVNTVHDFEWICPEGHLFSPTGPCEACRGHRYQEAVLRRCKRGSLAASAAAAAEKALHHRWRAWDAVDRFACPSAFLRDKLASFGAPRDRLRVLPNPVELPEDAAGPGDGWLYAGRLTPEKGTSTLARALGDLPGTIAGDGPAMPELRAGCGPAVRFTGHLAPAALLAELRRARVVVVPSIWWENFPYAVTEAQAAGRAVVASATGGIPEQIDSGVDGVLVPPGDADALRREVASLLADPDRALALGAAARARVARRLDPDRHLSDTLSLYRELL
jgi:glycosyltransferase involved in cell wall biosynthesis